MSSKRGVTGSRLNDECILEGLRPFRDGIVSGKPCIEPFCWIIVAVELERSRAPPERRIAAETL